MQPPGRGRPDGTGNETVELDPAAQTFVAESQELLTDMESALLRLEAEAKNPELLNAVFRAAHTIKGSAGVFGFDEVVAFTHLVESLLEKIRGEQWDFKANLVALLLACCDAMGILIRCTIEGTAPDQEFVAKRDRLVSELNGLLGFSPSPEAGGPPVPSPRTTSPSDTRTDEARVGAEHWHLSLRFGPDVLRNGMDPQAFLRYLTTLGDIIHLTTIADGLPSAADMDPEACYLGFEVSLSSQADKAAIENVFEFVRDDCQLRIVPPHSKTADYIRLIQELPEASLRLGEILVKSGALTQAELERGLQEQATEAAHNQSASTPPHPTRPLGEVLISNGAVTPSVVTAALDKQRQAKERKDLEARFIRVEADKLDQLINLVGELVIAGSGTQLLAQRAGLPALAESSAHMSRLVEEVRDTALGLRMVQIGATFQRFQRVVRDVSQELGKQIDLVISGGETELDKSVVERIGDPLMHLVRNAMDHGIEPPDDRKASGKPPRATVRLNAFHDSGSIVIEVSDDGRGLNRDKILRKARERGLVAEGASLSEQDIFRLIFEPGFSTADQVSNLSGRGVGMDVVKRNIEALRGSVELESRSSIGTTVRIRLPLTLAIIDGFLVGVGPSQYVIPLDMVLECVELPAGERPAAQKRGYFSLRGNVLPLLRIRELFQLASPTMNGRENIVVVRFGGHTMGLMVDRLMGELQTVIKPLGRLFRNVRGISGFTILGSGDVALILDVPSLVQQVAMQERPSADAGRQGKTREHGLTIVGS